MSIGVGVVLDRGKPPGPGERRFIKAVAEDPRFRLCMVAAAPRTEVARAGLVDKALQLEARVFPAPDSGPTGMPEIAAVPDGLPDMPPDGCDVVVDFSHADAVLAWAEQLRDGVWRLSAFAPDAGLAEARDRAAVTAVTLTRHGAGQPPQTLATARYDTKFLASRNVALIREKSVQMVLHALAGRVLRDADTAPPPAQAGQETEEIRAPFVAGDLPGYGLRTVTELATRTLKAAGERIGRRPGMFELRLGHGDGLGFDPAAGVTLSPPPGTYWADPFLHEHDGALYLFYEVYDYETRRGHLDVGRIEGETMVPLGTALKLPYHLSYPFVFDWDGAVWMIPETHASQRLELWRATDFPNGWELAKTTFEGVHMADTVVFEHDGQWWLFTNICQDSFGDFGAELHLYRIDGPMMNEIEPHPLNPVVIDSRTARGGGRVFAQDGKLYRTSQDNSHGLYGFGLNVMEITRLDMLGFSERRVRHVTGDFDDAIMACHHMDSAAGRFVIDVRRRILRARKPAS
ncbi:MAG: hypothetical protein KDK53_19720 [Maritimibacter sp.]|nr:hypothetical protein [Maritimibacter sp.]